MLDDAIYFPSMLNFILLIEYKVLWFNNSEINYYKFYDDKTYNTESHEKIEIY